jgi:uncharacterized protein YyaL (SSP411 family)
LYEARAKRVWPGRDDKIIASWNALMIRALVEGARVFGRSDCRIAAMEAATLLASRMVRDGRVSRSLLGDRVSGPGVLEDFASVALAFLDVYGLTFDPSWLAPARAITERATELFFDSSSAVWYDTHAGHEPLVFRPREVADNATPAGSSLMAELLLAWSDLDGKTVWRSLAEALVSSTAEGLTRYPQALGYKASVADSLVNGATQVALVTEGSLNGIDRFVAAVARTFVPGLVLAGGDPGVAHQPSLLEGRTMLNGQPAAYVCRGYVCDLPTTDPAELERQLEGASRNPVSSPASGGA